ncbi:MAG TPA: phasin family protein [Burkholderiaceae bacterium]|nr:phasin family protein [Burkholderiaceae bacterium]
MSTPLNPFGDLQTMMSQFQIPGVDLSAVVEARRKDIDALVAANQATLDAAQALSRKQMDMLNQAMQDIQQATRGAATGASGFDPAKQAETARNAVERAIADMKELAELAQNSQKEALAHLTARADEQMQEIRALVQGQAGTARASKK